MWGLLGSWADTEPPTHLDRTILAEVRAVMKTPRSWFARLARARVWATAAAAAALAVVASLVLPYQDSLRLCGKLLADAGLALPALPLSFLVALPYAFLPLLVVVLAWMYVRGNHRKMHGLTVGQAFAIIMAPYTFFACGDLQAMMIAGILLGTVTGALLGGAVSQWLTQHRPAGAPA
ncbi:MAG: hypothetical protein ACREJK_10840 [Candidatus Methylomirabilales bacterium]